MILTIDKEQLSTAINRVLPTTATESSHPLTGTIKIDASQDLDPNTNSPLLTFSSTNLTASTVTSVPAQITRAGTACVNAQKLAQIVGAFDSEDQVSITTTDRKLVINQRNRRYEIKLHDPVGFPSIAIIQSNDGITIGSNALMQAFDRVARFTDPATNILACIYFHTHDGVLEAIAMEGHVQARATVAIDPSIPERWWTIPVSFYKAARHLFSQSDRILVGPGSTYISLSSDRYETGTRTQVDVRNGPPESLLFVCKALSKLENPLEAMGTTGAVVHPSQLQDSLNAIVIGTGSQTAIHIDVVKSLLRITSDDDAGACAYAADTVPLLGLSPENPKLDMRVSSFYIADVLKSIGSLTEKHVVLNSISMEGMSAELMSVSIGSGYKEFGSASYIICPLSPTPPAAAPADPAPPKRGKKK